MNKKSIPAKLFSIEFLRIFFVIFIILGHIMNKYPNVKTTILSFFHTTHMRTYFGVEFFFILGGFFLYNRIQKTESVYDLLKKIYKRLAPALFFVFILCVVFGKLSFTKFPLILTLTTGMNIPGEVTQWGDWYVSNYFWSCFLFIGLFRFYGKRAFFWVVILGYFALSLKINATVGDNGTYYTFIPGQFVRAVYSMGLGLITAFLSEKIVLQNGKISQILFTLFEIFAFYSIFNYIARSEVNTLSFWEMEVIFAILLISIKSSYGWLSLFLNKLSKIDLVSRYCYALFLCHIVPLRALVYHHNYSLTDSQAITIIVVGAILLAVFEYHVIEKKAVPFLGKFFIKEQK